MKQLEREVEKENREKRKVKEGKMEKREAERKKMEKAEKTEEGKKEAETEGTSRPLYVRVIALLAVIVLVVLLVTAMILELAGHPYANAVLFVALFLCVVLLPVYYGVTHIPKMLSEWYLKLKDMNK